MQTYEECLAQVRPAALQYAIGLLHHREEAEDALQTASLRALQSFDQFHPEKSFKAWFFTILRNCCFDRYRQIQRQPQFTDDSAAVQAKDCISDLNQLRDLEETLLKLAPDLREILALRYFAEMSYAEIAESLEIPQGTVMSRLHSARHQFGKTYGDNND